MSRFKKILKWSAISILSLTLLLFGFGYWFMSLIPKLDKNISKTQVHSLPYLTQNKISNRGSILIVVTSENKMGYSGKETGYELTELSRAYYVFEANGFSVDIASPKGGNPSVIIDDEDMGIYDYAFLNDSKAQEKAKNTIPMSEVDSAKYQAIYFVGGKGAMWDFPDNQHIQQVVSHYYQSGKVIGAVCHGPAALLNVKDENGINIISNKRISGFTNSEELFIIPDAENIFPFLLEDQLKSSGAKFTEGTMYLENVVKDGNIITGQNPWSTWKLAETMIEQLGHEPKNRMPTPEENTIHVLASFEDTGYSSAKGLIATMANNDLPMNRTLIAMHSIVAAMQWKIGKSVQLVSLVSYAKGLGE